MSRIRIGVAALLIGEDDFDERADEDRDDDEEVVRIRRPSARKLYVTLPTVSVDVLVSRGSCTFS